MNNDREPRTEGDILDPALEREEIEQDVPVTAQRAGDPSEIENTLEPLFEDAESEKFRTQWLNIQSKFVDNPHESVREADELVENVLKSVTMGFHHRRTALEKQWKSGDDISTEDLRLSLQRYRSFFDRLLTLES